MFEHGDGIVHQKLGMINAVCGGIVVVENPSPPPPTIPAARDAHEISDALKPPCKRCVDSLTLRCEFVVHNSMAVKKETST